MRILLSLLETFPGQMDFALGGVVGILLAEIQKAFGDNVTPPNYKSMLLQTMSMCFFNNCQLTMQTIEENNQTLPVFVNWFNFMDQFKLEFEIRRIIFGLCSILRTP